MTITKAIIIFAALILLGSGVIGYGLYLRQQRSQQEGEVLAQVNDVLDQGAQQFARTTSGQRSDKLARAKRIQSDLGNLKRVPQEKRTALGEWVDEMTRIHQALEATGKAIRDLMVQLRFDFPLEPKQQLAPADAGELTAAIARAGTVADATVPLGRGRSVTVAEAFTDDVAELRKLAGDAQTQLAARQKAFDDLVRRATKAPQATLPAGAKELEAAAAETQEWQAYARSDPQKLKTLSDLLAKLAAKRGDQAEVTRVSVKLQNLLSAVAGAPAGASREQSLRDLDQALPEAKKLADKADSSELRDLIIRAENAKNTNLPQSQRDDLVGKILKALIDVDAAPEGQKAYILAEVGRNVTQLRAMDTKYAGFFDGVLKQRAQAQNDAEENKARQALTDQLAALTGQSKVCQELIQEINSLATAGTSQKRTLAISIQDKIALVRKTDTVLAAFFQAVSAERLARKGVTPPLPGTGAMDSRVDLSSLSVSLATLETGVTSMSRYTSISLSSRSSRTAFDAAATALIDAIRDHGSETQKLLTVYNTLPTGSRGEANLPGMLATPLSRMGSAASTLSNFVSPSSRKSSSVSSSAVTAARNAVTAAQEYTTAFRRAATLQSRSGGGGLFPTPPTRPPSLSRDREGRTVRP